MHEAMRVWQVGAPSRRSYADVFVRHGVALIGPGYLGPWPSERYTRNSDSALRQFARDAAIGDAILLRTGSGRIAAVGRIASEYQYFDAFDDVNGWDLRHGRRVRWYPLPTEHDFGPRAFSANPSRFSRVGVQRIVDYALRFLGSPPTEWQTGPLRELPAAEAEIDITQIPDADIRSVVALAQDLGPQMWDREAFGDHPSEAELIAHLTIPLFRALGWRQEELGLQWRRIDLAVFTSLPRSPESGVLVVESKRFGAGVETALAQGMRYVKTQNMRAANVLVTDGARYRLYDREGKQIAYANLLRLKMSALDLLNRLKRP